MPALPDPHALLTEKSQRGRARGHRQTPQTESSHTCAHVAGPARLDAGEEKEGKLGLLVRTRGLQDTHLSSLCPPSATAWGPHCVLAGLSPGVQRVAPGFRLHGGHRHPTDRAPPCGERERVGRVQSRGVGGGRGRRQCVRGQDPGHEAWGLLPPSPGKESSAPPRPLMPGTGAQQAQGWMLGRLCGFGFLTCTPGPWARLVFGMRQPMEHPAWGHPCPSVTPAQAVAGRRREPWREGTRSKPGPHLTFAMERPWPVAPVW